SLSTLSTTSTWSTSVSIRLNGMKTPFGERSAHRWRGICIKQEKHSMPEGPSLLIAKEEMISFKGKKIIEVSGNSKFGIERLKNKKLADTKNLGKNLLFC